LNPFYKNLALWLVITLMMIMLYNLFSQQHISESNLNYSQFLSMVNEDRVAEVVIQGKELYVTDVNRSRYKVYAPADPELIGMLRQKPDRLAACPMDCSAAGFVHSGENVQQRSLARAVGTDERGALSVCQ